MLRFLLLCVILSATAAGYDHSEASTAPYDNSEGSAFDGDDESDDVEPEYERGTWSEPSVNESKQAEDGSTTIIIIAAVSVVTLAVVAVVAIFLFRRHLQSREQGVYIVPAEQGQKAVV